MPYSGSPAVTRPGGIANRLLQQCAPADFDLLAPDLDGRVDQDGRLGEAGGQIELSSSLMAAPSRDDEWRNGQTVATAACGERGAVGFFSARSVTSAITPSLCEGTASRNPASRFTPLQPEPAIRTRTDFTSER